jgi:hypothetical protein
MLTFAMVEQQFLRSPQSVAARPPALSPDRIRIQINFEKAAAKTIDIQPLHFEMTAKTFCSRLKPDLSAAPERRAT